MLELGASLSIRSCLIENARIKRLSILNEV